jgi:uncharacterized protein (DUF302 family)
MSYSIRKEVNLTFDEALEKVTAELKKEGFGVLTEIDVKKTLKEKLDVDMMSYKILGACNPPFAHKALETDPEIGLLLPCNVIVYESESGQINVAAIDAQAMLQITGREDIEPLAMEVNSRLERVINNI